MTVTMHVRQQQQHQQHQQQQAKFERTVCEDDGIHYSQLNDMIRKEVQSSFHVKPLNPPYFPMQGVILHFQMNEDDSLLRNNDNSQGTPRSCVHHSNDHCDQSKSTYVKQEAALRSNKERSQENHHYREYRSRVYIHRCDSIIDTDKLVHFDFSN